MLDTLSFNALIWLSLAGLITGISKFSTGGMGLIILPVTMVAVPNKSALAIVVLMYIITDSLAVSTYRDKVNKPLLLKMLPLSLIGVLTGVFVVNAVNNKLFLLFLFFLTVLILTLSLYVDKHQINLNRYPTLAYSVGWLSGFISMIGNASGPLINLYLLAIDDGDKASYIGTRAWFFAIMNFCKAMGLIAIGLMTWETAQLTLVALPAVALGSILGYYFLKCIDMVLLKTMIRVMITISACRLLYTYWLTN